MSFTYSDLQSEVKRRGIREQSGTEFDTAARNLVNSSLFAISRAAFWRQLRRKTTFETVAEQTNGTMSATNDSKSFTGTGLLLITNNVRIGRRFTVTGSSKNFVIETITGEDAFTTDKVFEGTTASGLSYTMFGQEEYNLPIQTGRVAFLWHEEFGFPFVLNYVPSHNFFQASISLDTSHIPTHYKMWEENNVIEQPLEASVLSLTSSASADTSIQTTVFGTVAGFPDFEIINTDSSNGTTTSLGSKSFTAIERVTKAATSTGRLTFTANSANTTVATVPVGNVTGSVMYSKTQLWPLPQTAFPLNVWFYKDPWRLVADGDIHELGQDFDEAIILLAVAKIKFENSQKEGKDWFGMYREELRSLRKKNGDKLDFIPMLERPSQRFNRGFGFGQLHPRLSFLQLGGFFGPSHHHTF